MSHIYSATQKKYNDAWRAKNREYNLACMRATSAKANAWIKISKIFRKILLDEIV